MRLKIEANEAASEGIETMSDFTNAMRLHFDAKDAMEKLQLTSPSSRSPESALDSAMGQGMWSKPVGKKTRKPSGGGKKGGGKATKDTTPYFIFYLPITIAGGVRKEDATEPDFFVRPNSVDVGEHRMEIAKIKAGHPSNEPKAVIDAIRARWRSALRDFGGQFRSRKLEHTTMWMDSFSVMTASKFDEVWLAPSDALFNLMWMELSRMFIGKRHNYGRKAGLPHIEMSTCGRGRNARNDGEIKDLTLAEAEHLEKYLSEIEGMKVEIGGLTYDYVSM